MLWCDLWTIRSLAYLAPNSNSSVSQSQTERDDSVLSHFKSLSLCASKLIMHFDRSADCTRWWSVAYITDKINSLSRNGMDGNELNKCKARQRNVLWETCSMASSSMWAYCDCDYVVSKFIQFFTAECSAMKSEWHLREKLFYESKWKWIFRSALICSHYFDDSMASLVEHYLSKNVTRALRQQVALHVLYTMSSHSL